MTLIGGHVILRGVGTSGFLWNDIDTGMTFSAADRYDLRARVLGGSPTTVQAKLWKDGTPEPTAWAVTKTGTELVSPAETVAGGIGLRGGYGGAGSGEIRFDKFSADDITPAAPYEPSCDATAGCPTP